MKYQRGFSMVELMVGSVISLMITLTVAGSAQFLDIQKRITVGTNTVLETLAISYREVANDIKMVGYGLGACPSTTVVVGGVTTTISQQFFITSDVSTNSDSITSFYGDSSTGIAYSFLKTKGNGVFTTGYAGQLGAGNLALISDSTKCSVYAVSSATYDGTTTTVNVNATFNGKAWTSDNNTYPENSMVIGLSDLKLITTSVVNNTLQESDGISNTTVNVADNVVFFKAYYGLTDGSFVQATGAYSPSNLAASATNTAKIRSVRVFMVARSPVFNKKNAAGNCDATTAAPTSWNGGPTVDLTGITDWQCYRYKTSDFIVPLRNKVLS